MLLARQLIRGMADMASATKPPGVTSQSEPCRNSWRESRILAKQTCLIHHSNFGAGDT
jgi:hypothetical protein